jgi:hypothetical protein
MQLINFGDSWAHGADADARRQSSYSNLVARDLGYDYVDFSVPSTSIPGLLCQFRNFLNSEYKQNQTYLALFFVTAKERQLLFTDTGRTKETWPQNDQEYYKKYYSDAQGDFVANSTILCLQTMCKHYNIKSYFICGWQCLNLWPEIDKSQFYANGNRCIAQEFGGVGDTPLQDLINRGHKQYLIYKNWHPSIEGHQFIADLILRSLTTDQ